MKTTLNLFLVICLCALTISSVAQVSVSSPISVTDGDDSFGKRSPRLAVNANGEIMVFWMRTGNEAFYLSTKTASGFSDPIEIPFGGLNPNLWSGSLGPNMAAHGNDVYVTFEVYGDAIYVTHSADAGDTWEAPVAAFVPPQGRRATIPTIAVDDLGQPYVAYVNTNTSEGDAYYGMVKSSDFGTSYTAEVDVSSGSNGEEVCECCNGHIGIAENGDVYVAFRNNDANLRDIWMVRSTDGGTTFNDAYDVDETDWMAGICPSNGPHFEILDEEVINVFYSGAGVSGSGVYYSSFETQSGTVLSTQDLLFSDETSVFQDRPRIAGQGDTLAVVWQENYSGSTEIAMSISTSGSAGINTESFLLTETPSNQQYAEIIFANGSFHVVYEDNESGTVLYQEVSFSPTGLGEREAVDFRISPNPSSDIINIILPTRETMELQIIDELGRLVLQDRISDGSSVLKIGELDAGFYQVVLSNHTSFGSRKLIVE